VRRVCTLSTSHGGVAIALPATAAASFIPDRVDRLRQHERPGLRLAKGFSQAEAFSAASEDTRDPRRRNSQSSGSGVAVAAR
jgi:hypothetical protein